MEVFFLLVKSGWPELSSAPSSLSPCIVSCLVWHLVSMHGGPKFDMGILLFSTFTLFLCLSFSIELRSIEPIIPLNEHLLRKGALNFFFGGLCNRCSALILATRTSRLEGAIDQKSGHRSRAFWKLLRLPWALFGPFGS